MKTLAGGAAFMALTVVCATVAGIALGGLTPFTAIGSLFLGVAGGIWAWRETPSQPQSPWGIWDWTAMIVFALVSLRAFLWVLYPSGDEWKVLSPNNLGDLSLHITLIRFMASGVDFWPESPIFAGTPLVYPAGADLLNSLLLLLSLDLRVGLILVGLGGSVLTFLSLRLWGGSFAVAAFLFGGGLAGFAILHQGVVLDYQTEGIWKNAFLALFVTQRGLLYALPAGLLLLATWREEFFHHRKMLPRSVQVLLYAAMPLFHVHTFLFLSLVLAATFLTKPEARKGTLTLVALAFLPATLFVWLVTGGFSAASEVRFAPDWLRTHNESVSLFIDFGIAPFLCLIAFALAIKQKNREALCLMGVAVSVFLACCFVAFAQWPWDNTKLMLWSWLVCVPYVWKFLLRPLLWPAQAAICVLLFFTGAISLAGGLNARHGYAIAQRSELAAWQQALRELPAGATFATIPTYNHPLLLLGQKALCGYDGHLSSHGLDYLERYQRLLKLMQKPPGWEKELRRMGATHAAFRAHENPSGQIEIIPLPPVSSLPTPSPSSQ